MSTTETKHERPFAIVGQGSIFDGAAYWATLVGVYLMVGGLMFYSGKEKLFDDDGKPSGRRRRSSSRGRPRCTRTSARRS
jgi:hypothetical protein